MRSSGFFLQGHHYWKRTVPMSWSYVPTIIPRYGVMWYPWDNIQLHHEVWCGYQKGFVCQYSTFRRNNHVPWYCWQVSVKGVVLSKMAELKDFTHSPITMNLWRIWLKSDWKIGCHNDIPDILNFFSLTLNSNAG